MVNSMEELFNYQVIGAFRVLHLLFVAPLLYIIIYEMNSIYKVTGESMSLQPQRVATIRTIVGRESSGMRRLLFTNGDCVFINNPMGVKELLDKAGRGKPDDLEGIKISFHTLEYNVIDRSTMIVI